MRASRLMWLITGVNLSFGLLGCSGEELDIGQASQALTQTAVYDSTLKVPACRSAGSGCDSGWLLLGRANLGPELQAPNTINGTCLDGTSGSYHRDESLDSLKIETTDGTDLTTGKTVQITATVWAYSTMFDRLDLFYTTNAASPSWTLLTTLPPGGTGARTLTTTFTLGAGPLQAIRGQFRSGSGSSACAFSYYNDRDDLVFTVLGNDNPPTTAITTPSAGATLSSGTKIAATASDDLGIAKVEFYRDGTTLIGSKTSAPYSIVWNPYGTSNGAHTITSRAHDTTGHVTTSAAVTINVLDPDPNPTQVVVTRPVAGQNLSGTVLLKANAIDSDGVARVDFYVDGTLVASALTSPFEAAWDSTAVSNGGHLFEAMAYDVNGYSAPSDGGPTAYVSNP